jgi:hypothetical protein
MCCGYTDGAIHKSAGTNVSILDLLPIGKNLPISSFTPLINCAIYFNAFTTFIQLQVVILHYITMRNRPRVPVAKYLSSIRTNRRKQLNESNLLKEYNESGGNRIWTADELPMEIVKTLYQCITGRPAVGVAYNSVRAYRNRVREWLEKVLLDNRISDRDIAAKVRCTLHPTDHVKLGIRHIVEQLVVNGDCDVLARMVAHQRTASLESIPLTAAPPTSMFTNY